MIITDEHPDAKHYHIQDPDGNKVGKIKSLNLETGEAVRYASDPVTGKTLTEPDPAAAQGQFLRRIKLENLVLHGHRVIKTADIDGQTVAIGIAAEFPPAPATA